MAGITFVFILTLHEVLQWQFTSSYKPLALTYQLPGKELQLLVLCLIVF